MANPRRRILLIDPPLLKHPFWDPIRTSQPLGIWSIGSFLQMQGHEVELVCAPLEGLDHIERVTSDGSTQRISDPVDGRLRILQESSDVLISTWSSNTGLLRVGLSHEAILARIERFSPDVVGIACLATCMHRSFVDLAQAIRRRFPDLLIIAGGQHATAMTERLLLDAAGAIDFVVLKEGEHTTFDIVENFGDLERVRAIPGLAWLSEGRLCGKPRGGWTNLATLPPLDPGLIAHVPLPRVPVHTFGDAPVKFTDMMFSVGCHRGCPYCFSPVMRGGLRTQNWDQIETQLRTLKDHGYQELVLQDDDLLSDHEFFVRLLGLFKRTGLRWQDNGGMELELFTNDIVAEIIASGCTSIYIPINPRQLADRLPTEKAVRNIHYMKELRGAGVYTFTSGIYGVPNLDKPAQTYDDLRLLRDFHLNLVEDGHADASLVFPLSTLPGTPWNRIAAKSADFSFDVEDWIAYSIFVPQVYPRQLGRELLWRELLETHRALNQVQESYPWFSPFPNRLAPSGQRRSVLEVVA